MNKIVFLFVSLLFLSSCITESAVYSMKKLNSITTSQHKDLRGPYEERELLMYNKTRMTGTESLTIMNIVRDDKIVSSQIILRMNYMSWQFPGFLAINVNDDIVNLEPSDKKRNVISGTNVEETYYFTITPELLNAFKNANKIAFQFFKDEVIDINAEGITAINNFIS